MAWRCLTAVLLLWLVQPAAAQTTYDIYRVRAGDTVESIAERYDLPVATLQELNPFLKNRAPLANELLTVPVRRPEPTLGPEPGPTPPTPGGVNGASGVRGPRAFDGQGRPIGISQQPAASQPQQPQQPAAAGSEVRQIFSNGRSAGRLGLTRSADVPIYRHENGVTRELFRCPVNTRLVVVRQEGAWFGVMMADRNLGWVDVNQVALTATELTEVDRPSGSVAGMAVVEKALTYLGTPYVWGGNGRGGIDCSGLVQQCYSSVGIALPRVSREQALVGQPVSFDQLQAGDRLYFASDGQRIDHTGLYIGNGQFIHASGRRNQVVIDNLFTPYYWRIYVGARR